MTRRLDFNSPSRNFVSFRGLMNYMIAVGGAGSLGSPAAEAGTNIIRAASPTSTTIPPTK